MSYFFTSHGCLGGRPGFPLDQMEVCLLHHGGLSNLELPVVAGCINVQVLALILLVRADLLNPLLQDAVEVSQHREKGQDLEQDRERVPDLDIVFGLEADDQSLGDLVVPLVTDVAVVLVVHVVVATLGGVSGRGGGGRSLSGSLHAELGNKARVTHAFLEKD